MSDIKILIVDDHEIIHIGVSAILGYRSDFMIAGHAYDGAEAIRLTEQLRPEVIFMDISMPVMDGIEATRAIKSVYPNIKVIALSQHGEKEYVRQIMKNGVDGYLFKNSAKEEFILAIDTVLKNRHYFSYELSEQMINSTFSVKEDMIKDELVHLTRREIQIINKIAEGKNNQVIADNLFISLRTVETHRRNIMLKLKVNSVVALLKYASANGLIEF